MTPAAAPAHNPVSTVSRRLAPPTLRPPRLEDEEVKPYVIVSDLGKGSFATVYRGYHEVSGFTKLGWQVRTVNFLGLIHQQTRKEVAIKTVSRSGLSGKLFDNLKGEIDILKTLSHRHITRLLDLVVSN